MAGPIYGVGSKWVVAYPRAPSLSSFSFNNFFITSLFHFFSSYFLFFHFCMDFPKENSNSQSKQRNLPTMSKTQKRTSFLDTPKSNPILKQTPKPKTKIFYLETPNPNQTYILIFSFGSSLVIGGDGGQMWTTLEGRWVAVVVMGKSATINSKPSRIGHHQQHHHQRPNTPTSIQTHLHHNQKFKPINIDRKLKIATPSPTPETQTHKHSKSKLINL